MRRTQSLYDGFWRCLCPAFDERVSHKALNASSLVRPTASPLNHSRPVTNINSTQQHRHGTAAPQDGGPSAKAQSLDSFFATVEKSKTASHKTKPGRHGLLGPDTPLLHDVPRGDIVKALRIIQSGKAQLPDAHSRIVLFVRFLTQNRNYRPDAFIYECMMDAMVDPQGSAAGVRKLLQDMDMKRIAPTAEVCQSALQALTIHPDYVIRQQVIDIMHKYWHPIDRCANQNIAIGMLRDGQHELALAKFTEMHESNENIDLWVYDIFILEFGRVGFVDEMLQLLRQRKHAKGTDHAFRTLLLHVLEVFSKSYHEAGTKFVWEYVVAQPILNPPTAILENVLGTAARHADTKLATEALNILSSRGRVPTHQNEALLDAFAAREDVIGAFGVLAIMERNHAKIGRTTTRSIYLAMKKNPWLITEASAALEEMRQNHVVPLEAVTVVIEAMAQTRGSEAAMPLYDGIFSMTGKRPGFAVIRELILNCTNAETMVALTRDYGAIFSHDKRLHWEDMALYNRMIPACAQQGDVDRAFELAERVMKAKHLHKGDQTWHSRPWVIPLIEHAMGAKDSRVWPIVDEMIMKGDEDAERVQSILRRHQLDGQLEDWKALKNERLSSFEQAKKVASNDAE